MWNRLFKSKSKENRTKTTKLSKHLPFGSSASKNADCHVDDASPVSPTAGSESEGTHGLTRSYHFWIFFFPSIGMRSLTSKTTKSMRRRRLIRLIEKKVGWSRNLVRSKENKIKFDYINRWIHGTFYRDRFVITPSTITAAFVIVKFGNKTTTI